MMQDAKNDIKQYNTSIASNDTKIVELVGKTATILNQGELPVAMLLTGEVTMAAGH